MISFRYRATDNEGEILEGLVQAEDVPAAVRELHRLNLIPLRIDPANGTQPKRSRRARRGLRKSDVALFTGELATLLQAQLPLDAALEIERQAQAGTTLGEILGQVLQQVRGGSGLADALQPHDAFDSMYTGLVRAGEASGDLAEALQQLADYLAKAQALRERLVSTLIYPVLLVVVALVAMMILFAYVVPQFMQLFAGNEALLPVASRVILQSAMFIGEQAHLLLAVALLLVLGAAVLLRRPQLRLRFDQWQLRWPLLGPLWMKVEVSRFSRTLGLLLGNGVPLVRGLQIATAVFSNQALQRVTARLVDGVKAGQAAIAPLFEEAQFPSFAVHLIRVGEQTGRLEQMLVHIADRFDDEVQRDVGRVMSVFEPVLIVILGLMVAAVVLSVLVAILSVNELAI